MATSPNAPNTPQQPGMVNAMATSAAGASGGFTPPSGWDSMSQQQKYDTYWNDPGLQARNQANLDAGRPLEDNSQSFMGAGGGRPADETSAQTLARQQQNQATDFRSNMPNLAREMGENLKVQANQGLSAANHGTQQGMSSRGLLNSNINRGAQAGNRARTQLGVAQGTADINTGLMSAADNMDAQAIQTGVAIQQTQQSIQNSIYSQALARLNAQNTQAGGLMGLAGTAGMLAVMA